jgi:excinuclease UvrABC ATPase subunit
MRRKTTANIDVLFIRCSNSNTGVSGSGKSTLVKKNVSSHAKKYNAGGKAHLARLCGSFSQIKHIECRSKTYR